MVQDGARWWISSRSGWLLELLTELTNQQWLQEVANPLPPNVVDSQSLAISKKGTCLMACQSALSGKRGSSYVIDHSEQTWTCQRCYSRLLCPDHSVWVFFFFKS